MLMKRNRPRVVRNNRPQSEGQSHTHNNNNHHHHNNHRDHDDRARHHNRANLQQQHDKYLNLAREALSLSDRVLAESYFQHADHYLRLLNEQREHRAQMEAKREREAPQVQVEVQPILTETIQEDTKTEEAPIRKPHRRRVQHSAPTEQKTNTTNEHVG
jgi:Domain of unknown function (DUF4167)